jgi:DNA-binding response OmpR family regulator
MTEQLLGTVLCAAEAEADRCAIGRIFRAAGFQVMEASSGGSLVRWAVEKPDLIVLIGTMGHLDPYEACRYIRSEPSLAAIAVLILFDGPVTRQDRARALESGADDYLGGPVEPAELIRRALALLQARREQPAMMQRSGLSKAEAEDLLDWLENNGFPPAETAHVDGRGFVVRWRARPANSNHSGRGSLLQALRRMVSGMWSCCGKRQS